MWWKSRKILLIFCLLFLFFTIFYSGEVVKAEDQSTEGFVIEADRVVGSGMTATIIKQDTAANNGKLMIRFHYKSAMIYGMKLNKQVNSPKGPVTISLKANGPVSVKNMIVDTSALSFKGACLNAAETVPEIGMEQVVMVAHSLESENSIIKQLVLNTVSGQSNATKPEKLEIIQELSALPVNQLDKELNKISSGHLPLTCEDRSNVDKPPDDIGKITEPVKEVINVVTNPVEPITKPLVPIVEPIEPILKPLEPVTDPLEPVLKPVEPVTKPLKPVIEKIDPIVSGTKEKVEQVVKSVCIQLEEAKGTVTKELALSLIDEAITKKQTLNSICQGDSLTKELQSLEEDLLKSLDLVGILGKVIPENPLDQLNKMREKIEKEKDGAIIFSQ